MVYIIPAIKEPTIVFIININPSITQQSGPILEQLCATIAPDCRICAPDQASALSIRFSSSPTAKNAMLLKKSMAFSYESYPLISKAHVPLRKTASVVPSCFTPRSEERRVGKSVDLGGRRVINDMRYSV